MIQKKEKDKTHFWTGWFMRRKKKKKRVGEERPDKPVVASSREILGRYTWSSATLDSGPGSSKYTAPCMYLVDMQSFLETLPPSTRGTTSLR